MKFLMTLSAVLLILPTSVSQAQHSDIELGYDNLSSPTAFVIEQDNRTRDGFQIFESEFEALDPFNPNDFSSDEPGFTTSLAEGLSVNSGDQIWLSAVNASLHSTFGTGFVNYFDPATGTLDSSGRVALLDNSAGTNDLVLNGASIESGSLFQFIDAANSSGEIHDHVVLDLLDDSSAPLGAYGVMFQLHSDFDSPDGTMDLSSDPFWIVWNHGMIEEDFDSRALTAFGVTAVPEPGSAALILLLGCATTMRRRRSSFE